MAYDGTEGGMINRTTARHLMDNYENSAALPANNFVKGILYGRVQLEAILAQPTCKGIRIYYGKEGPTQIDPPKMILVGYDEDGNDLVDLIVDSGYPCPTHCPRPEKGI